MNSRYLSYIFTRRRIEIDKLNPTFEWPVELNGGYKMCAMRCVGVSFDSFTALHFKERPTASNIHNVSGSSRLLQLLICIIACYFCDEVQMKKNMLQIYFTILVRFKHYLKDPCVPKLTSCTGMECRSGASHCSMTHAHCSNSCRHPCQE